MKLLHCVECYRISELINSQNTQKFVASTLFLGHVVVNLVQLEIDRLITHLEIREKSGKNFVERKGREINKNLSKSVKVREKFNCFANVLENFDIMRLFCYQCYFLLYR